MITVADIIAAREKLEQECIKPEADGTIRLLTLEEVERGRAAIASLSFASLYPSFSDLAKDGQ